MAGVAMTAVQTQMDKTNVWGQDAINAAKSALSSLAALDFPATYPTYYGYDIPTFGVISPTPPADLVLSTSPDSVAIVIPTKPTAPTITDPTLGALFSITLPDIPDITFPDLHVTAPVYSITAPKEWAINVNSNILISDDPMVQAVLTRLASNIENGGTGLSETVETAIWTRDLERNEQQLVDSVTKLTAAWAKKGFSLPDGMLADSIVSLQKEHMNKMLDRTREIAIKQAELEQANLFKSMELAIMLSKELITMLIQYEELVVRAQESTAKFANEYIDIQIKTYMSMVEAYKATAEVNKSIVEAEISKVELYKAQLEGQRLIGQLNEQTVSVYKAQLEATAILIERYKTMVQAMTAELETEKLKIEANKLQFDAWAKKTDVDIVRYNAEVDLYKTESMVNISSAEFYSKQAEAKARIAMSSAELSLKSLEISEKSMNLKAGLTMEAAKGVAAATASMAAGAMAALSAHAGMTYSEGMTGTV